jgi:hypothetical protein
MRIRFALPIAVALLLVSVPARSAEWQVCWGDLHAHSSCSDGKGEPSEAYRYASDKCNFMALTDHNHHKKFTEAALEEVIEASQERFDDFVPLFAQEFSVQDKGNHINVFNIQERIPAALNSNFKAIYSHWLPDYQRRHPEDIIVCQFNHPKSHDKDYGIASFGKIKNYAGDWDRFVEDANQWVRLIAVVNGPANKTEGRHNLHAQLDQSRVNAWLFYLDKGMLLSPTCNHDTHCKSWGDLTTARTGVWIKGTLKKKSLLTAIKNGRCFATADKDLSVWYSLEGEPMGSQLPDMTTGDLNLKVTVKDLDEPHSTYNVEVWRDLIDDDQLASKLTEKTATSGQTVSLKVHHNSGDHELFLVHVLQTDESTDGEEAWTAPVFVGPGGIEEDEDTP